VRHGDGAVVGTVNCHFCDAPAYWLVEDGAAMGKHACHRCAQLCPACDGDGIVVAGPGPDDWYHCETCYGRRSLDVVKVEARA
jgi:hypothetical protein